LAASLNAPDIGPLFPFAVAVMFLFGLVFGSFLNVCIYRMPRGLSVVRPRSACPQCHAPIRGYDNVPVLSWLLLRGRCRDCKSKISPRYAVVELLIATLFALCFWQWGVSLATAKFCLLSFLLVGLIFTDLDCKLLPDALTLPGLGLGLVFSLLVPVQRLALAWIPFTLWRHLPFSYAWRAQSLIDSAAGAALGAFLVWSAGFLYLKLRGVEGMGLGDVKMMAMVGSFLGMELTLLTIGTAAFAASLFGLATMIIVWLRRARRRMSRAREAAGRALPRAWQSAQLVYRFYEIPFGAFLGVTGVVAFFCGERLIRWYMHLWMRP